MVSSAYKHADTRGIDIGYLRKIELDLRRGLLECKIDRGAQRVRIGNIDLARNVDGVAFRRGAGGDAEFHVVSFAFDEKLPRVNQARRRTARCNYLASSEGPRFANCSVREGGFPSRAA